MKFPVFCSLILSSIVFSTWQTDFEIARKIAKDKHELILLNFSGSDWCGPCIRMRQEIFDSKAFSDMAEENLVLVNADFPRNKKNKLMAPLQRQNDSLADRYNAEGHFPYTVLMTPEGKVIRSWDGLPKENAEAFTTEVKKICDKNK
jgi:thioredoxin-related protein